MTPNTCDACLMQVLVCLPAGWQILATPDVPVSKERKGKERKGKERKGKERKGKERKGKERKGNLNLHH